MTSSCLAPVLVVGGGPTGLMMDWELATHGVACRVIHMLPAALGQVAGDLHMLPPRRA